MADTTFTPGTIIASTWLNDVNDAVYQAAGAIPGSVARTAVSKLADLVNVKDFGAVGDGVTNDTAAFAAGLAYLSSIGGGVLDVPIGNYLTNIVLNDHNLLIRGRGGVGEESLTMLQPWDLALPTVQVSNNTRYNRFCGIENLVIAGSKAGVNGVSALTLKGGTVHFTGHRFQLMNGVNTFEVLPGGGYPVTTSFFNQFHMRTDISTVDSHTIYMKRNADPEYITSLFFSQFHINGPTQGFCIEIDGTGSPGIDLRMAQGFMDITPLHGIWMRGGSNILDFTDVHLDPGTTDAVIIQRDDNNKNLGNTFKGTIQHGGQRIKFLDLTTLPIPAELDTFAKKFWTNEVFSSGLIHLTNVTDPVDQTDILPYLDMESALGPWGLYRSDFSIKTAGKGIQIKESSNSKMGLSANMTAGALTIANNSVTANSRIFVTRVGTSTNWGAVDVVDQTAGVGFNVRSTNASDTAKVSWVIFEPAV